MNITNYNKQLKKKKSIDCECVHNIDHIFVQQSVRINSPHEIQMVKFVKRNFEFGDEMRQHIGKLLDVFHSSHPIVFTIVKSYWDLNLAEVILGGFVRSVVFVVSPLTVIKLTEFSFKIKSKFIILLFLIMNITAEKNSTHPM